MDKIVAGKIRGVVLGTNPLKKVTVFWGVRYSRFVGMYGVTAST